MTIANEAYEFIRKAHEAGRSVIVSTYTKHTKYSPKHAGMFKINSAGDLLVQRGKNWDRLATPTTCMVRLTAQ